MGCCAITELGSCMGREEAGLGVQGFSPGTDIFHPAKVPVVRGKRATAMDIVEEQ